MKISCNIIEDLLPLYHDDVCSADSKTMVDEHLRTCEKCRRILTAMDGEMELSGEDSDAVKALEGISSQWKKSKRKALLTGISIFLAVILLVFGSACGIWYWQIGQVYDKLADIMSYSQAGGYCEPSDYYFAQYSTSNAIYLFELTKSDFLNANGSLSIFPADSSVSYSEDGSHISTTYSHNIAQIRIVPQRSGRYLIGIEFAANYSWLSEEGAITIAPISTAYVDSELNLIYTDLYTQSEISYLETLLEENRDEIFATLFAAEGFFQIDFLENAAS